jgi:hypothetical protein
MTNEKLYNKIKKIWSLGLLDSIEIEKGEFENMLIILQGKLEDDLKAELNNELYLFFWDHFIQPFRGTYNFFKEDKNLFLKANLESEWVLLGTVFHGKNEIENFKSIQDKLKEVLNEIINNEEFDFDSFNVLLESDSKNGITTLRYKDDKNNINIDLIKNTNLTSFIEYELEIIAEYSICEDDYVEYRYCNEGHELDLGGMEELIGYLKDCIDLGEL